MLKFRVGQIWETDAGDYRRIVMLSDTSIQCVQWHNTKELITIDERTYEYSIVDGSSLSSKGSNLKAPYMWHINGVPVEKDEVLLPDRYLKGGKWDKVLNGSTIQKGDTWITRDGEEVVIGNIDEALYINNWPISESKSEISYSILGIRNSSHKVSREDIVYLVKRSDKEEFVEPAPEIVEEPMTPAPEIVEEPMSPAPEIVEECIEPKDFEEPMSPAPEIVEECIEPKDFEEPTKNLDGASNEKITYNYQVKGYEDVKIEVGDMWETRDGRKRRVVDFVPGDLYCIKAVTVDENAHTGSKCNYTMKGVFDIYSSNVYADLKVLLSRPDAATICSREANTDDVAMNVVEADTAELELVKEITSGITEGINTQLGVKDNILGSATNGMICEYKYNPIEDVERLKNYIGDKAKQYFISNSTNKLKKLISVAKDLHALETYLKEED